ncbi:MAG TPA: hypothetical protein VG368_05940, partial [Acidimicrobiales bacterium]|nr:hypothetical protein [Acidimicrobiales bacterium]
GVDAMQTWIDMASGNLANSEDAVTPGTPTFAEQIPTFAAKSTVGGPSGEGVEVTGVTLGSSAGVVEHDPTNPVADASGDVALPNISTATELSGIMRAQDGLQADTSAMSKAVSAYRAGLTIGS